MFQRLPCIYPSLQSWTSTADLSTFLKFLIPKLAHQQSSTRYTQQIFLPVSTNWCLFSLHFCSECVFLTSTSLLQLLSVADLHLPRDSHGNTDFGALVRQLKECPTLRDQADILYILYVMKYLLKDNNTNIQTVWPLLILYIYFFVLTEELIGWWSCQALDRVELVCVHCSRSCMHTLEPARSGGLLDTSLEYYAREWRFSPRSVLWHPSFSHLVK